MSQVQFEQRKAYLLANLSPEGKDNFHAVVRDRVIKHMETKEQAERCVVNFVYGIIGDNA
jgi:hypothetical protein